MMRSICRRCIYRSCAAVSRVVSRRSRKARSQDYQRAEQFLPGNVRHLVYVADVIAALDREDQPLLVPQSRA